MTAAPAAGPAPRYASPVDLDAYGRYGAGRGFDPGQAFARPRYKFQGRVSADGATGFTAEPGRYHLYISWGCPWAQRTAIVRLLVGLADVVTLSYVDDDRDGRGWAFRERRGPDPVNGFAFLAEAYEATEPGYSGHVSVPVLWDRRTGRIVSNNFPDITIDLGTQFGQWARSSADLYPEPLRTEVDELNDLIYATVNDAPYRVAGATSREEYEAQRRAMTDTLEMLDARLASKRYLIGAGLTEADVRLWPTLARFDLGYNPMAGISERRLTEYPALWAYTRDLYQMPAFRDTSDFAVYAGFGTGPKQTFFNDGRWRIRVEPHHADWAQPHGRDGM